MEEGETGPAAHAPAHGCLDAEQHQRLQARTEHARPNTARRIRRRVTSKGTASPHTSASSASAIVHATFAGLVLQLSRGRGIMFPRGDAYRPAAEWEELVDPRSGARPVGHACAERARLLSGAAGRAGRTYYRNHKSKVRARARCWPRGAHVFVVCSDHAVGTASRTGPRAPAAAPGATPAAAAHGAHAAGLVRLARLGHRAGVRAGAARAARRAR
jgi:hypothetical protein